MGLLIRIIKKQAKKLINYIKTAHKGSRGESKVNAKLNPVIFGKVEHKQLNNYMILDENGKSHQIDHIEIRSNGIFCIETKNYKGVILGGETEQNWTQCLWTKKYKMYNPVLQNNTHVYHLKKLLNNEFEVNSVIVLVKNNANRIKVDNVVNLSDLKDYLRYYNDGTNYSSSDIEYIYSLLLEKRANISNKEHVKNIKKREMDIKNNICPRCGRELVLRCSQYGKFYGCSGYPNCKFIKK